MLCSRLSCLTSNIGKMGYQQQMVNSGIKFVLHQRESLKASAIRRLQGDCQEQLYIRQQIFLCLKHAERVDCKCFQQFNSPSKLISYNPEQQQSDGQYLIVAKPFLAWNLGIRYMSLIHSDCDKYQTIGSLVIHSRLYIQVSWSMVVIKFLTGKLLEINIARTTIILEIAWMLIVLFLLFHKQNTQVQLYKVCYAHVSAFIQQL